MRIGIVSCDPGGAQFLSSFVSSNNKKEFIGIDEQDLNALGFTTLLELQNEADDFADLFIKEPGFVHNFTHVNWIDFVECADPAEGSKVLKSK